jgi:hypothetical protein
VEVWETDVDEEKEDKGLTVTSVWRQLSVEVYTTLPRENGM